MLYDFGLDENQLTHIKRVNGKINEIDEHFDLVMIAEYFSESLVLLKDMLCWELEDVSSFHLNGRMNDRKYQLDNNTRALLADYLKYDYLLYNHFKEKFINKLAQFGYARLESEVEKLNEINKAKADKCNLEPKANGFLKGAQKWYGPPFLVGYSVNRTRHEDCVLMTMSGLKYIERIREKQKQEAKKLFESM